MSTRFDDDLSVKSLTVRGDTTFEGGLVGQSIYLTLDVPDLSNIATYGLACPVAGTVTKIWSRLKAPLSTGDATLTAKIGATGITSGVVTITQVGSAAGDIDSATPSAANTVVAGSNLCVTTGGSNASAVGATVTFEIRRSA